MFERFIIFFAISMIQPCLVKKSYPRVELATFATIKLSTKPLLKKQ